MQAEIIKIDPPQKSRNGGTFIRVYFKSLKDKRFFKMDLVPGFRNFERWKPLLKVGAILDNLKKKSENTIDGDSMVRLHRTEDEIWHEFSKLVLR